MPEVSITHLLVDTATINRLKESVTGPGRFFKDYVPIAVGINFRIFTANAREQAMALQMRMNLTHTAYLEPDQDIAKDDQVVWLTHGGNDVIPPVIMRVIGIIDPSLVHHRKIQLEEIAIGVQS
jgi:hypothetical protein